MTLRIGNATTISVPQYQATWVGTILTDGAGQLDFIFGSEASGGSPSYLYVWNKYNQVPTAAINFDTGPTYTYSTATTRVARNSASNAIYFITGEVANSLQVQSQSFVKTVGAYPCYSIVGWGVNTTATSGTVALFAASVVYGGGSGLTLAGAQALMFSAAADNYYQLGFNTIYRFELGDGTDANTMDAIGQDLLNSEYLM
jgi:hypothetical protein